ncbi:hypothetical protein COCOBI_01-3590 [Coccomyxa sp. Obi]|nr:hypothetical protein COCOBI_01-3590 [Coccomyxa sp. Obi]
MRRLARCHSTTCSTLQTELDSSPCKGDSRVQELFDQRQVLTLERGIGAHLGKDTKLWGTGSFDVGVYPDLPAVMKWSDFLDFKKLRKTGKLQDLEKLRIESAAGGREGLLVRTCGVQLRGHEQLRRRLLLRAGLEEDGRSAAGVRPADALLLVSGSHPLRRALAWSGVLQDSVSALHLAHSLRDQGLLPPQTSLWAVANPLVDTPDTLERKVAAGAEVILTQPPLIYSKFESWFDGVDRLGVASKAKIVIGIPMLTSSRSMLFWLELCSSADQDSANQALAPFLKAEEHGSAAVQNFVYSYTSELINRVLQLPGVAGLHLMPVSRQGRDLAYQLAKDGCLQPRTHEFHTGAAASSA